MAFLLGICITSWWWSLCLLTSQSPKTSQRFSPCIDTYVCPIKNLPFPLFCLDPETFYIKSSLLVERIQNPLYMKTCCISANKPANTTLTLASHVSERRFTRSRVTVCTAPPRLCARQSGGCMYVTCHFLPWWVIFHALFSSSEILEFLLVRFTEYARFKVWLTLFVLQGQAEGAWWITCWISWQLETKTFLRWTGAKGTSVLQGKRFEVDRWDWAQIKSNRVLFSLSKTD